jgi:hypothetical protein
VGSGEFWFVMVGCGGFWFVLVLYGEFLCARVCSGECWWVLVGSGGLGSGGFWWALVRSCGVWCVLVGNLVSEARKCIGVRCDAKVCKDSYVMWWTPLEQW